MTEAALHRAAADFLKLSVLQPWRWSTFPAGGGGRVRGAMLMRAGLQKGWPDLLFLHPAGDWRAIELKSDVGRLSSSQLDFFNWAPTRTSLCRSLTEIEDALSAWSVPLSARISA